MTKYSSLGRIAVVCLVIASMLMTQATAGRAQDATPGAADLGEDPCDVAEQGAAPAMMTPGAMWPSMMTPGSMDPGIMGDPSLMILDMLLYHSELDRAIAQVAIARGEQPDVRALGEDVLRARQAEAERLTGWRQQWYPDSPAMPMGAMMGMMMGPMMQGTPWPGMPKMPMMDMMTIMGMMGMGPDSFVAALCTAEPVDAAVVDALIISAQMSQVMPPMMQSWIARQELRQFAQEVATAREQELEQLLQMRQTVPAPGVDDATPGEIQVELGDFFVIPETAELKAGRAYTFQVTNTGTVTHEFVIEPAGELDAPLEREVNNGDIESEIEDIAPGETQTLTWTFEEPGRYQMACHIPGHYEAGMMSAFEVVA